MAANLPPNFSTFFKDEETKGDKAKTYKKTMPNDTEVTKNCQQRLTVTICLHIMIDKINRISLIMFFYTKNTIFFWDCHFLLFQEAFASKLVWLSIGNLGGSGRTKVNKLSGWNGQETGDSQLQHNIQAWIKCCSDMFLASSIK